MKASFYQDSRDRESERARESSVRHDVWSRWQKQVGVCVRKSVCVLVCVFERERERKRERGEREGVCMYVSVAVCACVCLCLCVCEREWLRKCHCLCSGREANRCLVSVSLVYTHAHTHAHTHARTPPHIHEHPHSLPYTHTRCLLFYRVVLCLDCLCDQRSSEWRCSNDTLMIPWQRAVALFNWKKKWEE